MSTSGNTPMNKEFNIFNILNWHYTIKHEGAVKTPRRFYSWSSDTRKEENSSTAMKSDHPLACSAAIQIRLPLLLTSPYFSEYWSMQRWKRKGSLSLTQSTRIQSLAGVFYRSSEVFSSFYPLQICPEPSCTTPTTQNDKRLWPW